MGLFKIENMADWISIHDDNQIMSESKYFKINFYKVNGEHAKFVFNMRFADQSKPIKVTGVKKLKVVGRYLIAEDYLGNRKKYIAYVHPKLFFL